MDDLYFVRLKAVAAWQAPEYVMGRMAYIDAESVVFVDAKWVRPSDWLSLGWVAGWGETVEVRRTEAAFLGHTWHSWPRDLWTLWDRK